MYTLTAENKYGERLELTHNPSYDITEIDGLYPPEAVINSTKTAGMDGAVFNSAYMNSRTITITLVVNGPVEENRIQLYRYFKTKYPVRLYYKNGIRDVYIDGYVSKVSIEYFNQKQTVQVIVECPLPLFNATAENRTEFSTVESLFEFPFAIDSGGIPFSEIQIGKQESIINGGDMETGVLIRLNAVGNVVNPKIYNTDTGEYMIINQEMQKGDEITINTRKKQKSVTMLRDGTVSNLIGKLQAGSTWFSLIPGDNLFAYEADEASDNLRCTFIVNDQFEGV